MPLRSLLTSASFAVGEQGSIATLNDGAVPTLHCHVDCRSNCTKPAAQIMITMSMCSGTGVQLISETALHFKNQT